MTAGSLCTSRGVPNAKDLDALATDALFDLGNQSVRRSQQTGRRRRAYGRRSGSASWTGT